MSQLNSRERGGAWDWKNPDLYYWDSVYKWNHLNTISFFWIFFPDLLLSLEASLVHWEVLHQPQLDHHWSVTEFSRPIIIITINNNSSNNSSSVSNKLPEEICYHILIDQVLRLSQDKGPFISVTELTSRTQACLHFCCPSCVDKAQILVVPFCSSIPPSLSQLIWT